MKFLNCLFLAVAMVAASPKIKRRSSDTFPSARHVAMLSKRPMERFLSEGEGPYVAKERQLHPSKKAGPLPIVKSLHEINECLKNPCNNGSTCVDQVNNYTCVCIAGFTGRNCDTVDSDINECSPNPCKNGASCFNQVNNYTCVCTAFFTGRNCESGPGPNENGYSSENGPGPNENGYSSGVGPGPNEDGYSSGDGPGPNENGYSSGDGPGPNDNGYSSGDDPYGSDSGDGNYPYLGDEGQWISRVIAFSSQYSTNFWSAQKVIGLPNVYPAYEDNAEAWAPKDIDANQFLEFKFPIKVRVSKIDIYETFNAGGVKAIKCYDVSGTLITLWSTPQVSVIEHSRIFSPSFTSTTPCFSNRIRLDIDCSLAGTWVEIDAVRLHGYTDSTMDSTDANNELATTTQDSTMDLTDANNESATTTQDSTMDSTDAPYDDDRWKSGMMEFAVLVAQCEHMTNELDWERRFKLMGHTVDPPTWLLTYKTVCEPVNMFMGDFFLHSEIETGKQARLRDEFSKYSEVIRCYTIGLPYMWNTKIVLNEFLFMINNQMAYKSWCDANYGDIDGFLEFLGRRPEQE